jgi:hypothetical protein
MRTNPFHRRCTAAVSVVALGLLGAGCGGDGSGTATAATAASADHDEAAPATELTVTAGDYTFGLSATTVAAGRLPVELHNQGAEPHQLMVARLHDGVTIDDYLGAAAESEASAEALVDNAGGVNAVDAGATRTGYADLEPGRYVVLCFLPTPEGPSHLHEGMVAELTVVDEPVVDAPEPTGEITMLDFGFALPAGGLAEADTYRVVNDGPSDHELALMRIDDGKAFGDVVTFLTGGFRGEQPLDFVGGAGGVEPGGDTYVDLDLEPGEYVAMCFLPDAASGKRHAELGMVATFTIP